MLPRSKPLLALLVALPLALVVVMWSLAQKRPRLVTVLGAPASALALSSEGTTQGVEGQDGSFSVWSRGRGRRLGLQSEKNTVFNASVSSPSEISFSPDDKTLFASNARLQTNSPILYAWDVSTRQIKWSTISNFTDDLGQFWPSRDGKLVAQRSYDVVRVLDTSKGGVPQKTEASKFARSFPLVTRFLHRLPNSQGGPSFPRTLALSPDGKTVAVAVDEGATSNGLLEFWDVATGKKRSQTSPSTTSFSDNWQLQYSPDGRFLALFKGSRIWLWDASASKWARASVASANTEGGLAWMPDSRSLWTGAGTIQRWSVPDLKPLRELPIGGPIAVSGDGRTLATRSITSNGTNGVWLWDIG